MSQATIYASTNSRNLTKNSQATYALAHDAASADGVNAGEASRIHGQRKVGGLYNVYRQGMLFDASSLASVPNLALDSVILHAYFATAFYNDMANQSIVCVNGNDLESTPVAADFGDLLDDVTSWGDAPTSGMTINAFNTIAFNATGLAGVLAAILGSGTVKIGIKSSADVNNVAPNTEDYCHVYIGSTNQMYLEINYHAIIERSAVAPAGVKALSSRVLNLSRSALCAVGARAAGGRVITYVRGALAKIGIKALIPANHGALTITPSSSTGLTIASTIEES